MRIARSKKAWLGLVLCCLAGCSNDTAHSLSRDYRNINNECIDALMMVTSEARAKFVTDKIFKTFPDRVGPLDKRAATYEQNTDDKTIVLQMISSESVAILLAENIINQRRLKLEQERIKNLLAFKVRTEIEKLKAEGQANPDAKARDKWPSLNDLATGGTVSTFKTHLEKGTPIATLFSNFPKKAWDKARPKDWKERNDAFNAIFDKFNKLD